MARSQCLSCDFVQDPSTHDWDEQGNRKYCGGSVYRAGSGWKCSRCSAWMTFFKCPRCGSVNNNRLTD